MVLKRETHKSLVSQGLLTNWSHKNQLPGTYECPLRILGSWTLQNKVFSNQNKDHLGFR